MFTHFFLLLPCLLPFPICNLVFFPFILLVEFSKLIFHTYQVLCKKFQTSKTEFFFKLRRNILMGFLSSLLGILGFIFGLPVGLLIGFYVFIYAYNRNVQNPETKPLNDQDTASMEDLMLEIPLWVKSPDYDRVDWLNKFLSDMWPFLDKAICRMIKINTEPIFTEYVGKFMIKSIEFENLSLGNLPPTIHGLKVVETNEKDLVMEPSIKWAGNPNIVVAVTILSARFTIQLVDLQLFAATRITLKTLVPTLPCFANMIMSLMEKPCIDFGINVLGGDLMSIPGLYRYVQEIVKKEVSNLCLWPRSIDVPVLDASIVAIKKPVGIVRVKVIKATKLLKKDLLGLSDPYVKLNLGGEKFPTRKTTVIKKTLNPVWNEEFKLAVKDPQTQTLCINVYDWDKVGCHDHLGTQLYPLKLLTPNEAKEVTLDLLKNSNVDAPHSKKQRGQIMLELTYAPFRDDLHCFTGIMDVVSRKDSVVDEGNGASSSGNGSPNGAGLLVVTIQGAHDVEGSHHNNPFVLIVFRGERRKSKMIKKTRNPSWNEEFQFVLEEPPLHDKIQIKVMSKRIGLNFFPKESLGRVDIKLDDVVYNGRINEKYQLIDSKNGTIHVELRWKTI